MADEVKVSKESYTVEDAERALKFLKTLGYAWSNRTGHQMQDDIAVLAQTFADLREETERTTKVKVDAEWCSLITMHSM